MPGPLCMEVRRRGLVRGGRHTPSCCSLLSESTSLLIFALVVEAANRDRGRKRPPRRPQAPSQMSLATPSLKRSHVDRFKARKASWAQSNVGLRARSGEARKASRLEVSALSQHFSSAKPLTLQASCDRRPLLTCVSAQATKSGRSKGGRMVVRGSAGWWAWCLHILFSPRPCISTPGSGS